MNPNQKEAIIKLLEDIKQGIGQLQTGIEIAVPFDLETSGAIIHKENVLNVLKSILASANTGVELLREQAQQSKEQA